MSILAWLVLGLVAGFVASKIVHKSGEGLIRDLILGVIGAFVGGWLFRTMGWHTPFSGLAGTIFVAFIGAVILLVILRLVSRSRRLL